MLSKIEMKIPIELLNLPDIKITEILKKGKRQLIIRVESTKKDIFCKKCGNPCEYHGFSKPIQLRHLPILGLQTFIYPFHLKKLNKFCI